MPFGLRDSDIEIIQAILRESPALEQAIIYGSRAKGNYRNGSDIDLTLKGDGLTDKDLSRISWALDDSWLPYKFDLSLYHQLQHDDIKEHIARVGQVFYSAS